MNKFKELKNFNFDDLLKQADDAAERLEREEEAAKKANQQRAIEELRRLLNGDLK